VTTPIPGKPGYEYGVDDFGREGVFRWMGRGDDHSLHHLLPWWPRVTQYVVRKDHRGKILDTRYQLVIGGHEDALWGEELSAPEAWLRWPEAIGVHDKVMRECLAIIVQNEARRLPQILAAPAWVDGQLVMPPADLLPPGYAERSNSEPLSELLAIGERNPRVALILGFGYAAPYVAPLRAQDLSRQSFMVHAVGAPRKGKSTALRAAGALWGLPTEEGLIVSWDNTTPFITGRLGELGCLPIFLDELSSSGFTAAKLKPLLQSALQGSQRGRSTRGGRTKMSAPWHGIMFSTGNDSILGMLAGEPAIRSRVIEIATPITLNPEDAHAVDDFVLSTYGLFEARPLDEMIAAIKIAEGLLKVPNGGSERTILRHLALGVAGAFLVGGEALANAALTAAREVRDQLIAEMSEAGVEPGELLLEAVREAIMSNPGMFPTRDDYLMKLGADSRPDPKVLGYWEPPTAYIITTKLGPIAAEAGITDGLVGLRDLKRAGLLNGSGGKLGLRKRLRVGSMLASTYAITLPDDDGDATGDDEPTGNTGNTGNIAGQTLEGLWEHGGNGGNTGIGAGQEAAEAGNALVAAGADGAIATAGSALTCDVPSSEAVPIGERVPSPDTLPTGNIGGNVVPLGQRDQRRAAQRAELAEQLANFRRVIERAIEKTGKFPNLTEADLVAGLKTFSVALDGLSFAGHPARVGQLLYEKLAARYARIPTLDAPPDQPVNAGDVQTMFNFLDQSVDVTAHRYVVGLDVNAQFLAASGVELGTGEPRPMVLGPDQLVAELKLPGYVQLGQPTTRSGRAARWRPGSGLRIRWRSTSLSAAAWRSRTGGCGRSIGAG
jgi:hypothetical protein